MSKLFECPSCGEKVKPCPFCGGTDLHIIENYVGCENADCTGNVDFGDHTEILNSNAAIHFAIKAWNRRDDGWISVKDKIPDEGELVLAYHVHHGIHSCIHTGGGRMLITYNQELVTHWKPLLALPETN
ncbi:hypothetical protein MNBD_GAMMA12-3939 [hydrothermal vent metagenome]|uniref:DUF551 domain-containing protein n=1 Tax=hydrothermal vent metagenome TaxID=652676 RepID=A0A3B0YMA8_9ZZZZ